MKTPTQQVVKLAIEGGFEKDKLGTNVMGDVLNIHELLLDPTFFKAIGKVKGWGVDRVDIYEYCDCMAEKLEYPYQIKMHTFIDHRADGNTIDEALSKTLP